MPTQAWAWHPTQGSEKWYAQHTLQILLFVAGEGDEAYGHTGLFLESAVFLFGDEREVLDLVHAAYGDAHLAAGFQLVEERLGDVVGGAGDDDGVEGSEFGPAEIAVAVFGFDGFVAMFFECLLCPFGEWFHDLNRIDMRGEFGEDGGLVAGAGADFEDFCVGIEIQLAGHIGDDVGLGDGLVVTDG